MRHRSRDLIVDGAGDEDDALAEKPGGQIVDAIAARFLDGSRWARMNL